MTGPRRTLLAYRLWKARLRTEALIGVTRPAGVSNARHLPYDGPDTITEPGTLIFRRRITRPLTIKVSDVTIADCTITAPITQDTDAGWQPRRCT